MVTVLNDGAKGSNTCRIEMGKRPIPTSVNLFKLSNKPPTQELVQIDDVRSILCVTFVPKKVSNSNSGFYVNVFPWVKWGKGKQVPVNRVLDGQRGKALTAEERSLKEEHKPAGLTSWVSFEKLMKQHDKRIKILRSMKINVKRALDPYNNL